MAENPPPDLVLTAINGGSRTVSEWLTVFPLLFVAVDPYNERSAWIVPAAKRILTGFEQADCRVAWLVTGPPEDARLFLGKSADEILTFSDPDGTAVRAFGLERLPAIVHLAQDGTIVNASDGWDPPAWRALAIELARIMSWSHPVIPGPRDPGAFEGAPVPEPVEPVEAAASEPEAPESGNDESASAPEPAAS